MAPPVRERPPEQLGRPPVGITACRHGNAGPPVGSAARSAAKGVYRAAVRMMLKAGVPAERRTPSELGILPVRPPAAGGAGPHRENCPEVGPVLPVGAPLPARHSAWWRRAETCTIHHRPLRSPSSWNGQDHSTMRRVLVRLPDDPGAAQEPRTARSRWWGVPSASSTRSSSTPSNPSPTSHSCTSGLAACTGATSLASRWKRVWW